MLGRRFTCVACLAELRELLKLQSLPPGKINGFGVRMECRGREKERKRIELKFQKHAFMHEKRFFEFHLLNIIETKRAITPSLLPIHIQNALLFNFGGFMK